MSPVILAVMVLFTASAGWGGHSVPSPALEQAKTFLDTNRPAEAITILSAYKPSSGELVLYHRQFARAYQLSKQGYDAITHLRLAYLYAPHGEARESLLVERAEAYAQIGFLEEAAMCFKIFLKNFPDSRHTERAYLGLADALFKTGKFGEARDSYEKAGASLRALAGKANALNEMGRYQDAYAIYQGIIARDSGYLQSTQETLFNIGKNFVAQGELPAAKYYLSSVTDPVLKFRAAFALGQVAVRESRTNDAVEHFSYACQTTERILKQQALLSLAELHLTFGKSEEAKASLLEIRHKYPYGEDYDTALLMLLGIYKKEGETGKAATIMRELVMRPLPHPKALDEFERMILEARDRNRDEFLKLWKLAGHAMLKTDRSASLLKIAEGLRNSGKPFLELCTWLSQHGTDDAATQCHVFLADFYADFDDTATASRHLQYIPLKNTNDDIRRIRAKVFYRDKHYRQALDELLALKDIGPEDSLFLADLLPLVPGNGKSLELFEKAMLNKPDTQPIAYIRFADMLYKMGKKSDALRHYRTAISLQEKGKAVAAGEREWALFRIAILSTGEEYAGELRDLQKGDGIFNRYSSIGRKEAKLQTLVNRIF